MQQPPSPSPGSPGSSDGDEVDLGLLEHLWPDSFERTYPVWGKQVVLRSLPTPTVMHINSLVQQQPPEHQLQTLSVLTVAAALVSVDGRSLPATASLEQKADAVGKWDDALIAAVMHRYTELAALHRAVIEGIEDPNSSGPPADTTTP